MKHNKTSLFLMELIMAILFFSLASAICIEIFVKAHFINEESIQKIQTMKLATNIVEIYKSNQFTPYFSNQDLLYFDESLHKVDSQEAYYIAQIKQKDDQLSIVITHQNQVIYQLTYQHYQQIQL